MTSWIRVPRRKESEKERPYYFQVDGNDIAEQFTSYLYATMVSQSKERDLQLYDKSNPISPNFEMIRSTFVDVSGVISIDSALPSSTSLGSKNQGRVVPYLQTLSPAAIHEEASKILRWKTAVLADAEKTLKSSGFPKSYDLCVHLRSVASNSLMGIPNLSVTSYVQAVKEQLKSLDLKRAPVLFVISESPALLDDFKRRADPTWKLHNLPAIGLLDTSRPSNRTRLLIFNQYLAELITAQGCPIIISTLTSSTGRFLYLTVPKGTKFVSLDTSIFMPF